jgi:methylated-DNA-[protein]-cysteine S-methyltransferase
MLVGSDAAGALRVLDFGAFEDRVLQRLKRHYGAVALDEGLSPAPVAQALDAYFSGDIAAIDRLAVVTGGTEFQRAVWAALRTVGAGDTASYGDIARRIGKPKAFRAVGLANNANPIAIVVPCHRIVGSDGSLTGYGGGIERKRWLLEHEAKFVG